MTDVLSTRRRFMSASALLLGGTTAAALIPSTALAQDARVAQDISVLNYALTLERLEANFYVTGLQRFSAGDFTAFAITNLYDRLREIRDHEVAHVATVWSSRFEGLRVLDRCEPMHVQRRQPAHGERPEASPIGELIGDDAS